MFAGGIDPVEAFGLFRGNAAAAHEVGHADDGVHRRTDFVAHVGEEGTLGNVRGLGGGLGLRQFGGA